VWGDNVEEHLVLAERQLQRVRAAVGQGGLEYFDLQEEFVGIGIAVSSGQHDYVILSIFSGGEAQLLVTTGILHSIEQNQLAALEAANHLTQNHPSTDAFLHTAPAGWALLLQVAWPIELLLENPGLLIGWVRHLPVVAADHRALVRERWNIGGRPWEWTAEQVRELLVRSMA
jgi:hypothetical protein